jgi:ABC-type enterochelin transport system permease subunit
MLRLVLIVMAGLLIVLQVSGLILRLTQRNRSVKPARGLTAQQSGIRLAKPDQKSN